MATRLAHRSKFTGWAVLLERYQVAEEIIESVTVASRIGLHYVIRDDLPLGQ